MWRAYSSICGIRYDYAAGFAFNIIIDSGCTKHMFTDKSLFQSYKPCSQSFVILADKSRTACHGVGTVCLSLGGKTIILHDVLHVPNLWCPLLTVRCFRRLKGCSFLSDNSGCFLTFPTFFLVVDDSSDCIIQGQRPVSYTTLTLPTNIEVWN